MQTSFSSVEYANKKKITRRDRFLETIEKAAPWEKLLSQLEPHYPTSGKRGRQPHRFAAHAAHVCCAAVLRFLR